MGLYSSPSLRIPRGVIRSAGTCAAKSRSGFTIFELAVLLLILTAIASIGIPAYFGRPSVTLNNAATLLARDLREVQNRAALYEEQLWIRFDENGDGYRITDQRNEVLISPYGTGEFRRHYPVDAVFRGVSVMSVTPSDPGAVVFDPKGRPVREVSVVLGYGDQTRIVTIHKRTGLIAIDGLKEPWVDLAGR